MVIATDAQNFEIRRKNYGIGIEFKTKKLQLLLAGEETEIVCTGLGVFFSVLNLRWYAGKVGLIIKELGIYFWIELIEKRSKMKYFF